MKNKDLTIGNPFKVIFLFCLPLFGSIFFQQLYSMADSVVAGKFIGKLALAAVGNSYEITFVFLAFSFGLNIGCSVIVSRFFGAKKFGEMKTAVYTTGISAAVICAVLMIAGLSFSGPLLELIQTPAEIFADSKLYLDIYIWGLPFVIFYNIATGIFSAMGDAKTPFLFLACSSLANIAMDILFVVTFNMGVAGVAYATFICQGVSCFLAIIFLIKRLRTIKIDGKTRLFSWKILGDISIVAIPSVLQQTFISVGNIIIQGLINGYGPIAIGGYAGAIKLNNLILACIVAVGNGVSNYVSQNIGAGKQERILPGHGSGLLFSYVIMVPVIVLYLLCGKFMLQLFVDEGGNDVIEAGYLFLSVVCPFYCVLSTKLVTDGVLRGSSKMVLFMIATLVDLVLRVVLAFALSSENGIVGIWWSWPVGWIAGAVLSLLFTWIGCYRKKKPTQIKENA